MVGISGTHYQKIEYGETMPSILIAIRIAKELDITTLEELEGLFGLPQRQLRGTSTFETSHKNDTTN